MENRKRRIVETAKKVLEEEGKAIISLKEKIGENFSKAVNLLLTTRGRVVLTGMGKSGLICKKIAATLSSTGTPAFFLHPADAIHGDLGMLKGDDTVIAISNSGETKEVLNIIPVIKSFGIPIIAITNDPTSSLAKLADISLYLGIEREACPLGLAPMTTTTATLALGDAIAAALMVEKGFKSEDFARYHPGGKLGIRLSKVKELMRKGEDVPVVSPETSIKDAIYEISSKKVGATLVVENGKLVGILTDGDLRRFFEKDGNIKAPVRDAMTISPKTIEEEEFAEKAIEKMEKYKITVLPVVDQKGNLKGIIHLHDILGRRF
ncbi:KpsF/GutQ family sugar-phosphate isomerase [Desulfurobacterium atlanticum]|uniref:Arabinose-5-phosphate isomerase n=1 Tax=Desulfurobacterium atlanticum TaxID=240169 RepID=A0A238XT49_9BACT|nr:KpsF/GutQ family sugar-phosphate isomerase [Desulfurobacterium atlanticum]SNR61748.1 arabinose-5-phosphate isomerase [Desulfurobacterium atlanticum]